MIDPRHCRVLELDKILLMLQKQAVCEETKTRAGLIQPAGDFLLARRLMELTSDAHSLTNRYGTPGLYPVRPCVELVERARRSAMLSMGELLEIAGLLRCTRTLIHWKRQTESDTSSLDHLFGLLQGNHTLESDITTAIVSDEEMNDRASPELADIRRKIRGAHQRAREQLERITRSSTYQKYLQEQIITIRNGRFVVPVRSEFKAEIKGLVHDTSSSGATLFIEPMAVVELNNQIRELEGKQQHEINRILLEFSSRVAEIADTLLSDYDIILELDLIFAKSKLADQMRASVPELLENGETRLNRTRHPLIDAGSIVPIDLRLGGDFDTLVITGPNTGGKTVALKTLGLFTLMASCGLMLPCADESTVRFFPKVLADIGDEQSIEQSLSTFSGHMTNIVSILKNADSGSLVLMDELGAGTDPAEGAALGVAIISQLRKQGTVIAATTHYAEIKMYALQTDGVENASCEFDVATLKPTYRLLIGVPGRKNAFAISERLGLSSQVIDAPRRNISTDDSRFEDVVSSLEDSRRALEQEKDQAAAYRRDAEQARNEAQQQLEKLADRYEKELEQARERAMSIVAQTRFQAEQLMDELGELKKQKDKEGFSQSYDKAKQELRQKMQILEDAANPIIKKQKPGYTLPRALKCGDTVYLSDFDSHGTVTSPPDNKGNLTVQAGILKMKVNVSSVRLVDNQAKRTTFGGGTVSTRGVQKQTERSGGSEVNLRGMDQNEAILELEKAIDSAVLSGIGVLTAIHGKGTGALRNAVHARLKRHKSVRSFRLGTYGEGENGVTVIELK